MDSEKQKWMKEMTITTWQEEVGRKDKGLHAQLGTSCPVQGRSAKEVNGGWNLARIFSLAMNPGERLCHRSPKDQTWPTFTPSGESPGS